MTTWSADDLEKFDLNDELQITSRRADGSLRPFVTIWMAVAEGDVFVRSAYGPENGWYRRAAASGEGRVRVGLAEFDVRFATPDASVHPALDAAYHAKYDKYGARMVATVVSDDARDSTLRLELES